MTLDDVINRKRIVVCVGSGGVGKTTTAAAIALHAARRGRTALVCTIDPAKRLANSLGIEGLGHAEQLVPPEKIARPGEPVEGRLYAMMLDQKRAFDEVVERYARDPATRERLFQNRIYQQISTTLSGSQEFAAMAKLHALDREGRYDVIVLDTPPTANALDFLDAPQRVAEAVESPAIGWLTRASGSAGRLGMRVLGAGSAYVLKRLSRFTGSEFLDDLSHFFLEFNEVLGGFRQRAEEVFDLLRDPKVGFVLVASPEPLSIDEALFFYERLASARMPFSAFVVNRVHARLGPPPAAEAVLTALAARAELAVMSAGDRSQAATTLLANYRDLETLAEVDAAQIERLLAKSDPSALCVRVPFFDEDVHDLDGLLAMIRALFSPAGGITAPPPARDGVGGGPSESPVEQENPASEGLPQDVAERADRAGRLRP